MKILLLAREYFHIDSTLKNALKCGCPFFKPSSKFTFSLGTLFSLLTPQLVYPDGNSSYLHQLLNCWALLVSVLPPLVPSSASPPS